MKQKRKLIDILKELEKRPRKWKKVEYSFYVCSNCDFHAGYKFNRCPTCEAKYEGRKEVMPMSIVDEAEIYAKRKQKKDNALRRM